MMPYYDDQNRLFSLGDLRSYLDSRKESIKAHIKGLDWDKISREEDAITKELMARYALHVPTLIESSIVIDPIESDIQISQFDIFESRTRQHTVKGLRITVKVPFSGSKELFYYQPSVRELSGTPSGVINESVLTLSYETAEKNPEVIKQLWGNDIGQIKRYLEWVNNNVTGFNNTLEQNIKDGLMSRRREADENSALIDVLKQGN